MRTVHLTSIKHHVYAAEPRYVGDEYDASERDARLMVTMGNARETAVAVAEGEPPKPITPTAATPPKRPPGRPRGSKDKQPRKSPGRYKRRDMRSEQ